ncbi:hypothetical protein EHF33_20605 (plasmid) [Deinococcus psychrotolerans]|uniref:Uncharacterized protein n=1 Tax=Deinococcus psychrotolerans TaxID=2489213 RepID=A0A3G8YK40_9DEIO|nr:hypothetical protein [Deinococcus psychrotolerans]AZI45313.1 hypothetical protein EHF33_20605 [Deinococcus psychrotolerans]
MPLLSLVCASTTIRDPDLSSAELAAVFRSVREAATRDLPVNVNQSSGVTEVGCTFLIVSKAQAAALQTYLTRLSELPREFLEDYDRELLDAWMET